ncbi:hypothetical protein KJ627_00085 [Patescibacteria group bacterium]|nr:hypothetical protein [Patescibacteria group bacterium]MBU2233250.1 hypothetical protein [Patescibacteria group bacterium]MBU2264425.1 hypothetical protein [Patescibacteria group bacterium]
MNKVVIGVALLFGLATQAIAVPIFFRLPQSQLDRFVAEATPQLPPVPVAANIKVESGSIMIHDSIIPQNSGPLIITTDQNGWGKYPKEGDWFSKQGDWWVVAADRVPTNGIARFNAIRGAEWVNPQSPAIICGAGIEKYDNKDGTWCFTLLK